MKPNAEVAAMWLMYVTFAAHAIYQKKIIFR